jgi:hypothetical protein
MALRLSPDRTAAQWWVQPAAWEVRWQLEAESMRRDPTIAHLTMPVMRRMPDLVAYAKRRRVFLWDLLAYSANAESADGRLRLVAVFPGHPYTTHPDVLCLDGPRQSKHRNPPFEDGVFGKSSELCLFYRRDPAERRWRPENGLLGLFDIARLHVANEHEWRRTGKWPGGDAPHGEPAPAPADPRLAIEPLSPRNLVLHYQPSPDRRQPPLVASAREAA